MIAAPSVKDALVARLVEAAKKIKIGSGLDESVDMGPAVDEKQWKTDLDYIHIGRQEGARLVLGGNKPDYLDKGYFVEPTIFDNVEPGNAHFQRRDFRSRPRRFHG